MSETTGTMARTMADIRSVATARAVAKRSAGLLVAVLMLLSACDGSRHPGPAPTLEAARWENFQQRFVHGGQVIDSGNADISHSEGQGYGMLLAVAAGDQGAFDRLWRWTSRVLQRRDGLLSWRYAPCPAADTSCVTDSNNASDGDLLVAWALLRAGDAWGNADYHFAALTIMAAVAEKLVLTHENRTLLLPGEVGFRHDDAITVNLSYWVFPALQAFHREQPTGPWQALIDSGVALLDSARFGDAQLPPDWLEIGPDSLRPSPRFSTRYGFDAVRIPLYATWAGLAPEDNWRPLKQLWQRDPVPAWVDLDDGSTAEYAWSRGMASVARLVASQPTEGDIGHAPDDAAAADADYYSQTLVLLSHLAGAERGS